MKPFQAIAAMSLNRVIGDRGRIPFFFAHPAGEDFVASPGVRRPHSLSHR
jgi:hypothetical protein